MDGYLSIRKQIEKIHKKVALQKKVLFGVDRRKNRSKRDFFDSVYQGNEKINSEEAMILITKTCIRLREVWKSCGSEAVWDILSDGNKY